MLTAALWSGLFLLATVVAGAPLAFAVRRRDEGWAALAADTVLLGFLAVLLAPTAYAWLGPSGLVGLALGWAAAIVVAVRRRPGLPARLGRDRRNLTLLLAAVVVAVAAVLLRLHDVNFLPWLGDMGAYVNWANEFGRTGELSSTWPPLLPAFLGVASGLGGFGATTAALPWSGIVVIVGIVRVARLLGAGRVVLLVTAAVSAIHVHLVWYSSFPSSETLNAPLVMLWALALVRVVRREQIALWSIIGGLTMLALGLLRGTGPLLVIPVVVLAVVALVVRDWRRFAPAVWWFLVADVIAAVASYWYGITEIRQYYVDFQIAALVPETLRTILNGFGIFTASPTTAAALLAPVALIVLGAVLVQRRVRPVDGAPPRVQSILGVVLAAAVAAGVLGMAVLGTATWHILVRIDLVLLVGMLFVLVRLRRERAEVAAPVLVLGTIVAIFLALHTVRLAFHDSHSFFIYWDRYIVSESLPIMIALSAVAADRLVALVGPRLRDVVRRWTAVAAGVVAIAWFAVSMGPTLWLVSQDSYLRGAYEYQTRLDAYVGDHPLLWTATSAEPYPGFFFPNTHMAFARPFEVSYGYDVLTPPGTRDFGPDLVADAQDLADALACRPGSSVVVFEVRSGGPDLAARIDDDAIGITRLGTESGTVSLLSQPPSPDGWTRLTFTTDIWLVSPDGDPDGTCDYS